MCIYFALANTFPLLFTIAILSFTHFFQQILQIITKNIRRSEFRATKLFSTLMSQ